MSDYEEISAGAERIANDRHRIRAEAVKHLDAAIKALNALANDDDGDDARETIEATISVLNRRTLPELLREEADREADGFYGPDRYEEH